MHVHTTEDATIEGVLAVSAEDGLVLRAARFHQGSDPAISMQGEVFIPRSKVSFIQVTGGG